MNEVRIDRLTRTLPSSWNELTFPQLYQVCSLFNHNLTTPHFKLGILFKYLGIKIKLWNTIDPEDAYFLCESLNFLLEDVTLTKSLVKSIRSPHFPFRRYFGPVDEMSSSTFGEFTKAQVRYEEYNRTLNTDTLDEMIAVLFRPKKHLWWIQRYFVESPDVRMRFMDRTLLKRAKAIRSLDPILKKAILLYFSGIQASLPTRFPNVYKSKSSSKNDKSSGWSNLIISLADGKTDDQSLDRVMNSNLYNVLLGLEQKSIEYFEFIKKHPQND
ncbi:MAG: hypothetical protein NT040_11240 [Bacteroidetes bacterium]|nr:hypothetical protein [Bacteroidota bacterium]